MTRQVSHDNSDIGRHGAVAWPLAVRETGHLDPLAHDGTNGYELPSFLHDVARTAVGASPRARFAAVFHQVKGELLWLPRRHSVRVGTRLRSSSVPDTEEAWAIRRVPLPRALSLATSGACVSRFLDRPARFHPNYRRRLVSGIRSASLSSASSPARTALA